MLLLICYVSIYIEYDIRSNLSTYFRYFVNPGQEKNKVNFGRIRTQNLKWIILNVAGILVAALYSELKSYQS